MGSVLLMTSDPVMLAANAAPRPEGSIVWLPLDAGLLDWTNFSVTFTNAPGWMTVPLAGRLMNDQPALRVMELIVTARPELLVSRSVAVSCTTFRGGVVIWPT